MQRIIDTGIISVIEQILPNKRKIANAVKTGGIDVVEITMTVPGAIEVIKELKRTYQNGEILIGEALCLIQRLQE